LGDLESGDPFLPPDANTTGALEIVPVHHNMNQEIQGDWDPRDRSISYQLSITQQGRSTMMVRVEEGQRFLLEEEKNGVQ
jgi:hypothetical protein